MLYTINLLEEKEWEGKKFLAVKVKALDGQEFEATMWGDKWGERLTQITSGMQIEANPWQNPKNQKWSLYPPDPKKPQGGANYANRTASIAEAQERKAENIEKAQNSKEWSIMVASSMSNAVALAVAEYRDKTVLDNLDQAVLKWRKWILDNWNIDPKDIDPTK